MKLLHFITYCIEIPIDKAPGSLPPNWRTSEHRQVILFKWPLCVVLPSPALCFWLASGLFSFFHFHQDCFRIPPLDGGTSVNLPEGSTPTMPLDCCVPEASRDDLQNWATTSHVIASRTKVWGHMRDPLLSKNLSYFCQLTVFIPVNNWQTNWWTATDALSSQESR